MSDNRFPTVSGTVGMLRDAILSISRSNQEDMALGAALAIAGTLTANRFSYNGESIYTTMYVLNVAGTSAGKGAAIDLVNGLFGFNGLGKRPGFDLLGLRNYSSDVSIIEYLETKRTRLDVIDEFGQIFKGLAIKGDRKAAVCECLKSLFSAKDYFAGHHTKTNGSIGKCLTPSVGIFGTIQPATLANNITPEVLFDGFMGRFLYFMENVGADYLGNQRKNRVNQKLLNDLVDACLAVYPDNPIMDRSPDGSVAASRMLCQFKRTPLGMTKEANSLLDVMDKEHYGSLQALRISGREAEVAATGRTMELVEKLSWILCVSDGATEMTVDHVMIARQIVDVSNQKASAMLVEAGSTVENKDMQKILDLVEKAPAGGVRRRDIMRKTHTRLKQYKEIVSTLVAMEKVEEFVLEPVEPDGKPINFVRIPA